jgi:tetratricopeptide (TPR) repeat protein
MKKSIALLCMFLFNTALTALDPQQDQQVMNVVNNYCRLLCEFANSIEGLEKEGSIINLFQAGKDCPVFDDLKDNKEIPLHSYLGIIYGDYKNNLNITYEYSNQSIKLLKEPNIEKSQEPANAKIIIPKKISGMGLNKEKKEVIIVQLSDYKIIGTDEINSVLPNNPPQSSGNNTGNNTGNNNTNTNLVTSLNNNPVNAFSMYLKGLELYNLKQYEESLIWFEKSAKKGFPKAQIALGCMYINKEGCKHLKRQLRIGKGLEWLTTAAQNYEAAGIMTNEPRRILDRIGEY